MKLINQGKLIYKNKLLLAFFIAILTIIIVISIIPFISRVNGSNLVLFKNNKTNAVLVIRDQAGLTETDYKYIIDSAALIREHFMKATGHELLQFTELEYRSSPEAESFAGKIKIHLGWDGLNPHPDLAQNLIDLNAEADYDGNHGYVFAPYVDNVVIQSPTPLGVRYGAAAFLRKYLDVEWLMPGPYGADTPTMEKIIIPRVLISSAPAFNMRYAWDERTPVDWLLNHGLQLHSHTKMGNFSHALSFYFDPDKYYDEHPEYYPIQNGENYRPTDDIAWQPRFSEPGTVEVAANEIIALLKEDPNSVSVSLGVNDSGGYCEQELAEQEAIYGLNSEGLVHMTDLYCKWSNAVIEKVLAEFPGRNIKFGMIAYRNLNDPPREPGLKFHESMIPYITKDRSAWVDSEQEAQGHQITLDWLERSSQLGWYNYEYGSIYLVPRIYNSKMQENLQFAQANGLKYLFSEAAFSIDEGPKPHIFAMLNWNPQYSLEELEDRWYQKAVGAKAAPHLAAFYDVWEGIWTEDIPQGNWFEKCKNFTYLWFSSFDYLEDIPFQKVLIARQHLDNAWEAVQNSGNVEQQKRLEAIRKIYALEEATVFAYSNSYRDLNQADALEILEDGFLDEQSQIRDIAMSRYSMLLNETDALINRPTTYFEEVLSDTRINPSPIWAIVDYIKRYEADGGTVVDRVLELAGALTPSYERQFCRLVVNCLQGVNIINDPSFEESPPGEVGQVEDVWVPWVENPGTIMRNENPAFVRTGSQSVKVENQWTYGAMSQIIPVHPGLLTVRSHYYSPPESRPYGALMLVIQPIDPEGNILEGNYAMSKIYDLSISPGEWMTAEMLFEVPEVLEEKKVEFVYVQVVLEEQNDVPLYLDDIEAYQAPETGMLDALVAEIRSLDIDRTTSEFYTSESWIHLRAVYDRVTRHYEKDYIEYIQRDIDSLYSELQSAKESLVERPLKLIETNNLESVAMGDPLRLEYHPENRGTATLLEAVLGCVKPAQEHDWALGTMLMENQSYPENFAAYNELDISTYFQHQLEHKYLSFRLSNASEIGNNFTLHSHLIDGCEPRIVIKKKDGTELILYATNGLEVRTPDADANYNDIADYYDWGYTLCDSSFNVYNSVLYLIFDLKQYPEAMTLDPETIDSVNLEISQFYGNSSPYYPPLIRVTGLYDYPGNSRWSAETLTWNSQPEIVLNNLDENDPGVIFRIYGDGTLLYESQPIKNPSNAVHLLRINVTGIREIILEAEDLISFFNVCDNWADVKLMYYD